MLRENSKNFVDGTQNERIERGGTEAEVLYVGHFKRRHSLEKVIV